MRRLRGHWFDAFGWAAVRRVERAMIPEYTAAIGSLLSHLTGDNLTDDNLTEAVAIASLPDRVRGYEHLKLERAGAYRDELSRRVLAFTGNQATAAK
jgi:indolepyruvate ferredoxin oxidoreductase